MTSPSLRPTTCFTSAMPRSIKSGRLRFSTVRKSRIRRQTGRLLLALANDACLAVDKTAATEVRPLMQNWIILKVFPFLSIERCTLVMGDISGDYYYYQINPEGPKC